MSETLLSMVNDVSSELPPGWAWSTVGDVTEKTVEQKEPDNGISFLYIDITSIDNKTKRISHPKILPIADAPSRARQHLRPGDVLVSMTRPHLNAIAILPEGMVNAVGSTALHVLRTRWILPSWLFYIVQTSAFIDAMSSLVQGALYPAVRPKDIDTYRIPIAPLAEQHRIVSEVEKQISRLDSAVAGLERAQVNLRRDRGSVLNRAYAGKLVPTEARLAKIKDHAYESADRFLERILFERRTRWEIDQLAVVRAQGKVAKNDQWKEQQYEEPNPPNPAGLPVLPEGWTWTNLEQLKSFSLYGPRFSSEDYASTGYLVLRTSDISESGKVSVNTAPKLPLSEDDFLKYKIERGDLLITRTGSIGTLAVFDDIVEAIPGAYLILYRLAAPVTTARYVFYFLKSSIGQEYLVGGSGGVGRLNLNAPTIESIPIPLPPLAEQKRIVNEIERRLPILRDVENVVETNLKRAEVLRQKILKHAFEGRLVTQDPNDEAANILLERIRVEKLQREQEANALQKIRRAEMSKVRRAGVKRTKKTQRRPLLEVLSEMRKQLRPEELFVEAGFDSDEVPESIDEFYKELGSEIKAKRIKEIRPNNTDVYLKALAS